MWSVTDKQSYSVGGELYDYIKLLSFSCLCIIYANICTHAQKSFNSTYGKAFLGLSHLHTHEIVF